LQPAELPALVKDWQQRRGDIGAAAMAGIEERSGSFRVHFRYPGKPHILTPGKVSEAGSKSGKFGGS